MQTCARVSHTASRRRAPLCAEEHLVQALVKPAALSVLAPENPRDAREHAQRLASASVNLLNERDLAPHRHTMLSPTVEHGLRANVIGDLAQQPPDVSTVGAAPGPTGPRVNELDLLGAQQLAATCVQLVETIYAQPVKTHRERHVVQLD